MMSFISIAVAVLLGVLYIIGTFAGGPYIKTGNHTNSGSEDFDPLDPFDPVNPYNTCPYCGSSDTDGNHCHNCDEDF